MSVRAASATSRSTHHEGLGIQTVRNVEKREVLIFQQTAYRTVHTVVTVAHTDNDNTNRKSLPQASSFQYKH